jgi:hypothetical protein
MAIIRKVELRRHIEELESRYKKLREAISGGNPNPNIYDQYSNNPEQYKEEFTEVNDTDVEYALSDFRGVLKRLETIQKLQAPRLKASK